ncbi:hypothetical protein DEO72_LG8g1228 [Vigna unguiculata]|uniref:Uncharacterized protein n=1 Tax=Vigna unguiculata TaxID=3917 RepID=A0A4D6MP61_VIGUN|nr:hypothetical protein DEO72_LG8g1228 [Vigna unguiculata]
MKPQDSTIRILNLGTTTWQWNYVLAMRRHCEAFAELYPYWRHHHVASVELRPGLEAPPRPPVELHPSCRRPMELRPTDEAPPRSLTTRVHTTRPCLAQARRPRSGEGDPLAQATPFSLRRELGQKNSGSCESSLRRVPSRLSEIHLAQNGGEPPRRPLAQEVLGESLLVPPRRDKLAWARKPKFAAVHTAQQFEEQSQKLEEQRDNERTRLLWNPKRKCTKKSFREYKYKLKNTYMERNTN